MHGLGLGTFVSGGQVAPGLSAVSTAKATPYCAYSTWRGGGFGRSFAWPSWAVWANASAAAAAEARMSEGTDRRTSTTVGEHFSGEKMGSKQQAKHGRAIAGVRASVGSTGRCAMAGA